MVGHRIDVRDGLKGLGEGHSKRPDEDGDAEDFYHRIQNLIVAITEMVTT